VLDKKLVLALLGKDSFKRYVSSWQNKKKKMLQASQMHFCRQYAYNIIKCLFRQGTDRVPLKCM